MKINTCIHINGQLIHEFVGCIQHTVWCVQRLLVSTHTCVYPHWQTADTQFCYIDAYCTLGGGVYRDKVYERLIR